MSVDGGNRFVGVVADDFPQFPLALRWIEPFFVGFVFFDLSVIIVKMLTYSAF